MHLDCRRHVVYFWSIATSTFTESDQKSTSRYIGKRMLKDHRSRRSVCHSCVQWAGRRGKGIGMRAKRKRRRGNVSRPRRRGRRADRRRGRAVGDGEASGARCSPRESTKRGSRTGVRTQWWWLARYSLPRVASHVPGDRRSHSRAAFASRDSVCGSPSLRRFRADELGGAPRRAALRRVESRCAARPGDSPIRRERRSLARARDPLAATEITRNRAIVEPSARAPHRRSPFRREACDTRHSRSHSSARLATTSRRYFVPLSRWLPRLVRARTKAGLPYREP